MSSSITWPPSLVTALSQFREGKYGDGRDGEWIVVGYEGKSSLQLVGQGSGGIDSNFYSFFPPDECRFSLIRRDVVVELAKTVKVAFIDYTPGGIKPLQKALISTHKSAIKELFKPHSVAVETSNISDITDEAVLERIAETSGIRSKVTEKPTNFAPHVDITRSIHKDQTTLVPSSVKDNRPVQVEDEGAIRDAVKDVRNDATPTNWVLIHYATIPTTLRLFGTGSGGVEEMISNLNENEVFYGMFRVTAQYDKTTNVRFAYFKLVSPLLPPMHKAKLTTQSGFIQSLFQPFHSTFDCTHVADISVEIVTDHFQSLQQTKQNVLSHEEAKARAPTGTKTTDHGPAAVPSTSAGSISFTDGEGEFRAALAEVRHGQADWLIAGVTNRDSLSILQKGSGDADSCIAQMDDSMVNFGLIRLIEKIDNVQAVKFALVRYQPPSVSHLKKSAVSTKKSQYDAIFSPFHVDFTVDHKEDLSHETIMERITSASGSQSKVREKK